MMARVAPVIPAETDLLCEGCGYTLNGLPQCGNCPECGKPISESIGGQRVPPDWERAHDWRQRNRALRTTSWQVIFQPTRFYRTLATRRDIVPASCFARRVWKIAAVCLGLTAAIHATWYT